MSRGLDLAAPSVAADVVLLGMAGRHRARKPADDGRRPMLIERRVLARGGGRQEWVVRAPRGPAAQALAEAPAGAPARLSGTLRVGEDDGGLVRIILFVRSIELLDPADLGWHELEAAQ
jgi:hypothetical protein